MQFFPIYIHREDAMTVRVEYSKPLPLRFTLSYGLVYVVILRTVHKYTPLLLPTHCELQPTLDYEFRYM